MTERNFGYKNQSLNTEKSQKSLTKSGKESEIFFDLDHQSVPKIGKLRHVYIRNRFYFNEIFCQISNNKAIHVFGQCIWTHPLIPQSIIFPIKMQWQ